MAAAARAAPAAGRSRAAGERASGRGLSLRLVRVRVVPGENANGTIADLDQAAVDLAAFVRALRRVDTTGAPARPPRGRGGPLAEGDEQVRRSVAELGDRIDADATSRSWEESLRASVWDGQEVWVHGDLLPGNLLVVDGRLSAVIDFGGLNVGDPACDLQPAWNVFAGGSRARFRAELEVDDASWLRGRGWALYQAASALAYYWDTNPGMISQASYALEQVLADSSPGRPLDLQNRAPDGNGTCDLRPARQRGELGRPWLGSARHPEQHPGQQREALGGAADNDDAAPLPANTPLSWPARSGAHEALRSELGVRVDHHTAGDSEVLGEHPGRRKRRSPAELVAANGVPQGARQADPQGHPPRLSEDDE